MTLSVRMDGEYVNVYDADGDLVASMSEKWDELLVYHRDREEPTAKFTLSDLGHIRGEGEGDA